MRTPKCTECGSSDVTFETDDGEWPGEDFFYCDNCDATFRPDTNMSRDEFRGHMKSSGYTTEAAKKTLKKPVKKSGADFSHLSIPELEDLLRSIKSTLKEKQKSNTSSMSKKLGDFEEMVDTLCSSVTWDEDLEGDLTDGLFAVSEGEGPNKRHGVNPGPEIGSILSWAKSASKTTEILASLDSDEAENFKDIDRNQKTFNYYYDKAMDGLVSFWSKYVSGKKNR